MVRLISSLACASVLALTSGCQHQPAHSASHHGHSSHASHPSHRVHLHGAVTSKGKKKHKKAHHPPADDNATASSTPVWGGELD